MVQASLHLDSQSRHDELETLLLPVHEPPLQVQ